MHKLLTVKVFLWEVVYEKHKNISELPVIDDLRFLVLPA
jgi:hypothetical protein